MSPPATWILCNLCCFILEIKPPPPRPFIGRDRCHFLAVVHLFLVQMSPDHLIRAEENTRILIFSLFAPHVLQPCQSQNSIMTTLRLVWPRSFCYCGVGLLTCCPLNQTLHFTLTINHHASSIETQKTFSRPMRSGLLSVKIK